jgi:hypothetical protein
VRSTLDDQRLAAALVGKDKHQMLTHPNCFLSVCRPCHVKVDQSTVSVDIDHDVPEAEIAMKNSGFVYEFKGCKRGSAAEEVRQVECEQRA